MSKRCPQCQTDNRDQANRCMNCNYAFPEGASAVRMCPAGRHVMDPGWSECPYCGGAPAFKSNPSNPVPPGSRAPTVAEGAPHRRPTLPETESDLPPAMPPPPMPAPPMRPVSPGPSASVPPAPPPPPVTRQAPSPRRKTVFVDATEDDPNAARLPAPASGRRIVAILVTYAWRPEGQVYPVFEGRNYIGSDPDCEICVSQDPQLSARHSTIIFRGKGGQFIIDDEKSMNGTFVNGTSVDSKQPLGNYDKINTGATAWTFIILDPDPAPATAPLGSA